LLSGFEQAMIEHRIRGRKVLVGGGWGQITPQMPVRCCGSLAKLFSKYCEKSRGGSSNKIMDVTGG